MSNSTEYLNNKSFEEAIVKFQQAKCKTSQHRLLLEDLQSKYDRKLIKKKHWFTGFSVTLGISPSYDLLKGAPTIVVGPTLGYSIYQW